MEDTIAAISTPVGEGGVGIVRISGKDAFLIAQKIFKGPKKKDWLKESHKLYYGKIVDPETKKSIDEVLISIMKAPTTYTKEDVVEINCHGGYIPLKETLRVVLSAGARMAEPGEFTKRAFINGRIDLSQAESVIDIIRSKTEASLRMAMSQLEGHLSEKISDIQNNVLGMLANIEAVIDFPDEDIEEKTFDEMFETAEDIKDKLNELLELAETGRIFREGVKTVIVGRPNVGKSSLLNALLGQERAIVTDIPGTTRDVIEETINIKGIPLVLVDTAGLRETGDLVEKIGVKKTWELVNQADLILFITDAQNPFNEVDKSIIKEIKPSKTIIVINKIDLNKDVQEPKEYNMPIVKISALSRLGIYDLENLIEKFVTGGKINSPDSMVVSRARHQNSLIRARKNIEEFISALSSGIPLDLLSIDIRNAWEALGEITGSTVTEDLLDRIFSDFCIGK